MLGPALVFSISCGAVHLQNAREDSRESHDVAAVEREVLHTAIVDETGERLASGIDERRGAGDGDFRLHRADFEGYVQAQTLTEGEPDVFL
jgi:hypothetical protein